MAQVQLRCLGCVQGTVLISGMFGFSLYLVCAWVQFSGYTTPVTGLERKQTFCCGSGAAQVVGHWLGYSPPGWAVNRAPTQLGLCMGTDVDCMTLVPGLERRNTFDSGRGTAPVVVAQLCWRLISELAALQRNFVAFGKNTQALYLGVGTLL